MSDKIDFYNQNIDSFSEKEKNIWEQAQLQIRERDELIKKLMFLNNSHFNKWKDIGVSYSSIRNLLNLYEKEEISFGKLVEEIRVMVLVSSSKINSENFSL
jgi:hypothetical protein